MTAEFGRNEQLNNRSTFTRNLTFPHALFLLPKTTSEYRSACMAISIYSLIVMLLAILLGFGVMDYVFVVCLSAFALLAAISLIRMAWLKKIDSVGLYCFAIGAFISFLFILLYFAMRPYAGRPGNGLWLAAGLLCAVFWTPFFARFFLHGRKLLNETIEQ
jgi:hypothetical protein